VRIEIDGRPVTAESLWETASGYGHFTAMQVRGTRTRGLQLHLDRLEAANRELFDLELDREHIRHLIRHALAEAEDGSVRVYVFESDDDPATMVTVRPPAGVATPQRLRSVSYQRPEPHLKHLATGQGFYGRLAHRDGFDDALLTAAHGEISETTVANICFFDGSGFVWPSAPQLRGITMQLLERRLPELGVPSRGAAVRLDDVASFAGAFLANARGCAAVSAIDRTQLSTDAAQLTVLADAYASVPWDAI
jgi:branched-subunit amino acid aminotransferase/4-amino-4-deoxychorismate lyase